MKETMLVNDSILQASALSEWVGQNYGIGKVDTCELFNVGINDTYLVRAGERNLWLRIYRRGWRTNPEVSGELTFLMAAHGHGMPVCPPVPLNDGSLYGTVIAPEGARQAALFMDGHGAPQDLQDLGHSRTYGQALALLHSFADGHFATQGKTTVERPSLDFDHLFTEPMGHIERVFPGRVGELNRLRTIGGAICSCLGSLDINDQGLCHGDAHFGNIALARDGSPKLFDFDCMGYGPRVYDMSVFRWNEELTSPATADAKWGAFLEGYSSVRSSPNLGSSPMFMVLRQIWLLGLHCQGLRYIGRLRLNEGYLSFCLSFIGNLIEKHHLSECLNIGSVLE